MDERGHIAAGMEWFATGHYTYDTTHPPLARIALAFLPYVTGATFQKNLPFLQQASVILNQAPDYFGLLARARAGNLVFFWIACLAVWLLAYPMGVAVAVASVVAFTLIPVVLGHAGVATTDMAVAGCLPLAYWSWRHWTSRSGQPRRAALAGAATGLAVVSKFSAIVFLPPTLVSLLVSRLRIRKWREYRAALPWQGFACAAGSFLLVAWSVYRFEILPFRTPPGRQFLIIDQTIGSAGRLHDFVYRLLEVPLPFTPLLRGLGEVLQHNAYGQSAYLFGHVSQHGWWYFFPVVLAVKTPLAFSALALLGVLFAVFCRERSALECAGAGAAVVLVGMLSNLNFGVRHVLPFYTFVAPVVGLAIVRLYQRRKLAVVLLGGWLLAGSLAAHPHYLADFNLLAGKTPERIVIDSDLDWGQDLPFATDTLRRLGAREAWIAYRGNPRLDRQPGIAYHDLPPNTRVTGWVAASVASIYFSDALARAAGAPQPYAWLEALQPVARAGRSMLIYHIGGAHP